MILTGKEITAQVERGRIVISPFQQDAVNPNSYNYRLGDMLRKQDPETGKLQAPMSIPDTGYVLEPHRVYLANTFEVLGSNTYAMSLIGRSSMGRLGLFLQVSANLGHVGSCHSWTLELVAAHRIRIYPRMTIGQLSFWKSCGKLHPYDAGYSLHNGPQPSKFDFSSS